jgi:hypothetical protein
MGIRQNEGAAMSRTIRWKTYQRIKRELDGARTQAQHRGKILSDIFSVLTDGTAEDGESIKWRTSIDIPSLQNILKQALLDRFFRGL